MNPLPGLINLFTSFWLWSVVGLVSLAISWLVNDALGKKLNRRQLSRLLRRRRYAVLYHALLQGALSRIDRWLTPRIGPSDESREAEGQRAWCWPLFDFSLRLALAYPLLTLIVAWGLLGTDGKIGSLVVLPAAGWGVRIGVLVGLALVFWLVYRSRRAEAQGKLNWAIVYVALSFPVASAVASAGAVETAARRTRFGVAAYAGLLAFLLVAQAVAMRYSPTIGGDGAVLIVFLALLPLLNALFDFCSIGLTRFLLRRGAVSAGLGTLGWAFGDLAAALGFFALLGLALVALVQWMNELGTGPLLDLGMLFADIRADPDAYWWLYVTLFSTLLPTLLHFVLASFSALLAIMPETLALFIRRQLPRIEEDAVAKALAFWTLSTIGFLAIAAVAFGLYGLVVGVVAVFPYAGDIYLYWFERYAAWLGASVVPVWPSWL